MCNELQSQHEEMDPSAILLHLIELFVKQSRTQRDELLKRLFRAWMAESSFVQAHLIKTIEWIERLAVPREELSSKLLFFLHY